MAESAQAYYEGENLGGYQYMKLSEVINDFILRTHDNVSYLYGIPRSLIVRHAKAALQDLHKEASKDFKVLELSIGDDLVFKLPQDFLDYIRVSKVTSRNTLAPLDINYNLNIAETYLQDNEYNILFDQAGDPLKADGNNLSNNKYRSYQIEKSGNGGQFQADTSQYSENGEFTIDKRSGVMYFSSTLAGNDIVLEYKSDGMDWERIKETEITFHKYLLEPLRDLIYFNCIETRNNVPANEKYRARQQYKTARHRAKIYIAEFDLKAIAKVWRKGAKWVKG